MADYTLHLSEEPSVTLSAAVLRRLIDSGNGDAALLYLAILRRRGSADGETLQRELHWDAARRAAAERELARLGLLSSPVSAEPETPAEPEAPAEPACSREDLARRLENDASFAALLREVERDLGTLSTPSVQRLLGLYETLGLPGDVIYLLVQHCIRRRRERFGDGRRTTMREIEKEGYVWARNELFSVEAANAYLKREESRRARYPGYMRVLQLGDRPAAPAEERYFDSWSAMGFSAETIALAYDRTMLRCHELKWAYLDGILKKWHEKGLHTPQEVRSESAPVKEKAQKKAPEKNGWMKEYL